MATIVRLTEIEPINAKIIKNQDAERLLNTIIQAREIEEKCQQQQDGIQARIEEVIQEAYTAEISRLSQEHLDLWSSNDAKMEAFFIKLEAQVVDLVYKILHRLGFNAISATEIKNVFENEYNDSLTKISVLVQANSYFLQILRLQFKEHPQMIFKLNENLRGQECIFETDAFIFRLHANQAIEQIKNLLGKLNGN